MMRTADAIEIGALKRATPQRTRWLSPRVLPYLLVAPAVIYLLGLTLYPFIYAVRESFYENAAGVELWVGWENYQRLFGDSDFWGSLLNTVIISGIALLLEMVLGMGAALLVSSTRWIRTWRMIFLAPMLFMPSAVAFLWKLAFFPGTSVVNDLLIRVGLVHAQLDWLGKVDLARLSLIVADVWEWTPFLFIIFLGGLQGISEEIVEAARIDGARWYNTFWFITLPLLRPVIVIALILRGIDVLTMFTSIAIMTKGGPAGLTETVSYFIYRVGFSQFDQGYAAAASVVVLIATVVAAMFLVKRFLKSVTG